MLRVILSILLTVVLISCSSTKEMEFKGESGDWSVIYSVYDHGSNSQEEELKIKYVGEKSIPEVIDYNLKGMGSETRSENRSLSEEGTLSSSGGACSGCGTINEDNEFEITIEWGKNSDTLVLNKN
jgi:hypothetical protein